MDTGHYATNVYLAWHHALHNDYDSIPAIAALYPDAFYECASHWSIEPWIVEQYQEHKLVFDVRYMNGHVWHVFKGYATWWVRCTDYSMEWYPLTSETRAIDDNTVLWDRKNDYIS